MPDRRSLETRLLKVLLAIGVVAVLGVLAILPYRLYERDIRNATVDAHRLSSVVHTALSNALAQGEDPTDLINRLQGIADLDIRLVQLKSGESHPAAANGHGTSSVSGTVLTYVAPPIFDQQGGSWLAEMSFDLAPLKRDSVRLIIDLVLAVVLGSAIFSAVVFMLIRQSLVTPLRQLTHTIERRHPDHFEVEIPEFETSEMKDLADAVERACAAHSPRP